MSYIKKCIQCFNFGVCTVFAIENSTLYTGFTVQNTVYIFLIHSTTV